MQIITRLARGLGPVLVSLLIDWANRTHSLRAVSSLPSFGGSLPCRSNAVILPGWSPFPIDSLLD